MGPSHPLGFFLTSHWTSTKDPAFPLKHRVLAFIICFSDVALALITTQDLHALLETEMAFSLSKATLPHPQQPNLGMEWQPASM